MEYVINKKCKNITRELVMLYLNLCKVDEKKIKNKVIIVRTESVAI